MIARAEALFNMGQVILVILSKNILSSNGNNVVLNYYWQFEKALVQYERGARMRKVSLDFKSI